jgi:dienelactone hydrolase
MNRSAACALALGAATAHLGAEPPVPSPETRAMVADLGRLATAPSWEEAPGKPVPGLRRIFFESVPWQGRPTKVFAWLGIPEDRDGPVPGVVLVHGGGGTAYREWVQRWNERGYAAISIAHEGQVDVKHPEPGWENGHWVGHERGGPRLRGIYVDSEEPLADQWIYHASAATILAHSLLASLPEVQADRIGLMGVSWGGVVAATVAGLDPRSAFVISAYGCGHLADGGGRWQKALENNELYRTLWDPFLRLAAAKMPMLWLSFTGENNFSLVSLDQCSREAGGPQMLSFVPEMGHGHPQAWNRPEGYAFADAVLRNGQPWLRPEETVAEGSVRKVSLASDRPLDDHAVLVHTADRGFTGDRTWSESPAGLSGGDGRYQVTASIPAEATAWFFNVTADGLHASVGFASRP